MRDIVWRIEDDSTGRQPLPSDSTAARSRLERGNTGFVEWTDDHESVTTLHLSPADLGVGEDGKAPPQRPFATVISCADARVPVELVFSERANDLFVVRVAGGVLSEEAMGSLDFALMNMDSVVVTVSLGHTGCGAVSGAVDTYLQPGSYLALADSRPLLALVQKLFGAVRLADHILHEVHGSTIAASPGYRDALVELSVLAQAGANAASLSTRMGLLFAEQSSRVAVVYAVYDLAARSVGVPGATADWVPGLVDAPADGPALEHSLRETAFGPRITGMLESHAR